MDWRDILKVRLRASRVRFDHPLRGATTLRIGGPAECLVDVEGEDDLAALLGLVAERELPLFILGKGSNVLIPDDGLRGVVMRLGRTFSEVERLGESNRVVAGAGQPNPRFLEACRRWGLGGMEFLTAIPGTIGGAIAMNAGAHDGETARYLRVVRFHEHPGGIRNEPAESFRFGYRESPLRGQLGRIVLAGQFELTPLGEAEIRARIELFQEFRRRTQPRDFPNSGSVFKNPPGEHAARLIDAAGLKGARRGGAQVSDKHANFIVNRGGATAADVVGLVDLVRQRVYQQTGIDLELEIQVL